MGGNTKLVQGAIIELLRTLKKDEARALVCALAIGASRMISSDISLWPNAERLVFNGKLLLFCSTELKDDDVAEVINAGIQIEDVEEIFRDPEETVRECARVEKEALRLLTRSRGA
jgi:hypothetical protein